MNDRPTLPCDEIIRACRERQARLELAEKRRYEGEPTPVRSVRDKPRIRSNSGRRAKPKED